MYDEDIKIAGNKPSVSVKENAETNSASTVLPDDLIEKSRSFGVKVADEYCKASGIYNDATPDEEENMLAQRHLLLSFTVTIGFETYLKSEAVAGIAQKSFLDTLKSEDDALFRTSSDTGAFSFYYLAFRRGGDIERRIGQTFAMLCAHDGDPIYQELGEVLYCWFSSRIKEIAEEYNFI